MAEKLAGIDTGRNLHEEINQEIQKKIAGLLAVVYMSDNYPVRAQASCGSQVLVKFLKKTCLNPF